MSSRCNTVVLACPALQDFSCDPDYPEKHKAAHARNAVAICRSQPIRADNLISQPISVFLGARDSATQACIADHWLCSQGEQTHILQRTISYWGIRYRFVEGNISVTSPRLKLIFHAASSCGQRFFVDHAAVIDVNLRPPSRRRARRRNLPFQWRSRSAVKRTEQRVATPLPNGRLTL
jgi:hypothetical protein